MEIVTIPEWYDPETAAKTINYAPYNTLEVIKPYNDGYIVGVLSGKLTSILFHNNCQRRSGKFT